MASGENAGKKNAIVVAMRPRRRRRSRRIARATAGNHVFHETGTRHAVADDHQAAFGGSSFLIPTEGVLCTCGADLEFRHLARRTERGIRHAIDRPFATPVKRNEYRVLTDGRRDLQRERR